MNKFNTLVRDMTRYAGIMFIRDCNCPIMAPVLYDHAEHVEAYHNHNAYLGELISIYGSYDNIPAWEIDAAQNDVPDADEIAESYHHTLFCGDCGRPSDKCECRVLTPEQEDGYWSPDADDIESYHRLQDDHDTHGHAWAESQVWDGPITPDNQYDCHDCRCAGAHKYPCQCDCHGQ